MSYLLSREASGAPEEVTIWRYCGFDAFGQPNFTAPEQIYGIWSDMDALAISGSGKDEQPRTKFTTEEEIEIGTWIVQGREVSDKPSKFSREIRSRTTMKFITDRFEVYTYLT